MRRYFFIYIILLWDTKKLKTIIKFLWQTCTTVNFYCTLLLLHYSLTIPCFHCKSSTLLIDLPNVGQQNQQLWLLLHLVYFHTLIYNAKLNSQFSYLFRFCLNTKLLKPNCTQTIDTHKYTQSIRGIRTKRIYCIYNIMSITTMFYAENKL